MKTFILSLIFFTPIFIYSQDNQGKIIGIVIDTASKPIPYATVSLLKTAQSTEAIKRIYTNAKGKFELVADTGKYILTISHVSYPLMSLNMNVKTGENFLDTIRLTSTANVLQNVTVTVRKPLIEQSDDRITYNVESDPAAKSESATDILRKTPLITVDGNGNVQLNGQGNFKILLNGRETSMFAANAKEALKSFPGAVISKIEVITSPSAKYDAEGVGGIINIITKKKVIGYNGFVSSYYSTLTNYSENASLNLKAGKIGISAYAGIGGVGSGISNQTITETTPYNPAAFSKRTLNGERLSNNSSVSSNLEVTYDLDSFKTIAVYGNLGRYKNNSVTNQFVTTEHNFQSPEVGLFHQDNSSSNPTSGIGTDFLHRFRNSPENELSFRFNGQFSKNHFFSNSIQDNPTQDRFVSNKSLSQNREYTLQADFAQPFKDKKKLETGVKAIVRKASSDFESLIKYNITDGFKPNPANTDLFNYYQEVYSAYVSYNFSYNKYSFRTGLRAEHTNVKGDFITSKTTVDQNYTNLIPNLLITRRFSGIYTLTTSYNMRLQRPYIINLNPFVNNNDSLNISYGNPNLGPQVLHAVSLQNRFIKGKSSASISINGSYTNNMVVQFVNFNST
nr:outer membrane beta-barrel protein [Segetibacter sp.]